MKPEDPAYPPEKLAALRTVRKLVEFWQIRPQELRGPLPPAPPPPAPSGGAIRYRHPVSGETWNGHGEHPQWLRDALLKEGYTVDELRRAVADAPSTANGADVEAGRPADR
jgi:DNA-binding protein H-NS